jgi:hypothetical protein
VWWSADFLVGLTLTVIDCVLAVELGGRGLSTVIFSYVLSFFYDMLLPFYPFHM